MTVAVITGSQTCLPESLVEEYRITVLPFMLEMDGELYRDRVDITVEEFYRRLPDLKGFARSSAVSPGVFLETYESLASWADGILVVTIAQDLSAVYNNASLAARRFEGVPVEVLDSRTAVMAQGFAVLEAARAAKSGSSLSECLEIARSTAQRAELFAYIETFEFLKRSGRVPAIKAFAASALSVKPVFRVKDGAASFVEKKFSSRKARESIAGHVERYYRERGPLQVSVFHAADEGGAGELTSMIGERVEVKGKLILTEFTPVMGAHTGPGVLGASFL